MDPMQTKALKPEGVLRKVDDVCGLFENNEPEREYGFQADAISELMVETTTSIYNTVKEPQRLMKANYILWLTFSENI